MSARVSGSVVPSKTVFVSTAQPIFEKEPSQYVAVYVQQNPRTLVLSQR